MRLKRKIYYSIMCLLFLIAFYPTTVIHASEEGDVGYNIQAVIPENQRDKSHTYFDLKMSSEQEQTIEVLINNTSDKKETFEVSINQAYTDKQGFIDYTESDVTFDKSLHYKINDLVTYKKEVTVEAQESVKYPITIKMPAEIFDGKIMAGIRVMKKDSEESNGQIKNKVGYVLGLTLSETDAEIKREIELINVEPAVSYGKTSVVANIRNPQMDAYGKLKYVVNIVDEKTSENVRSVTYDSGMELAPNSVYGLAIDWEGKRLVAGEYKLNLVVTDAKDNEWTFNQDFDISSDQAKDINKLTVDKDTPMGLSWWIYLIIGLIILLIIIVVVFIYRNKRKKKKIAELKRKKVKQKKQVNKKKREGVM